MAFVSYFSSFHCIDCSDKILFRLLFVKPFGSFQSYQCKRKALFQVWSRLLTFPGPPCASWPWLTWPHPVTVTQPKVLESPSKNGLCALSQQEFLLFKDSPLPKVQIQTPGWHSKFLHCGPCVSLQFHIPPPLCALFSSRSDSCRSLAASCLLLFEQVPPPGDPTYSWQLGAHFRTRVGYHQLGNFLSHISKVWNTAQHIHKWSVIYFSFYLMRH